MNWLRTLLLVAVAAAIAGCSVSRMLTPVPGTDVSSVQPQRLRQEVEAILGAPLREWVSATGTRFCLYEYDGGFPGSSSEAGAALFLDLITLGAFELVDQATGKTVSGNSIREKTRPRRLIVSYDANDRVLGVFDEFAVLPEDGFSTGPMEPSSTPPAPPARP